VPKEVPLSQRGGDGGLDARVVVAVDGRAPGADEVDQLAAVGGGERGARGPDGLKNGAPPTERKARTGEFTPPSWRARVRALTRPPSSSPAASTACPSPSLRGALLLRQGLPRRAQSPPTTANSSTSVCTWGLESPASRHSHGPRDGHCLALPSPTRLKWRDSHHPPRALQSKVRDHTRH